MGIMLETTAERLAARGGPHWACPDKHPARRLETMRLAGELGIPFTSGILVGIGETRQERVDALLELGRLAHELGHLREVIVQNFRAKPDTRMAEHPDASLEDHLWSVAVGIVLISRSCTPWWRRTKFLADAWSDFPLLLDAGIDDWGGVSPVTVDHVNPEAPWPEVERLRAACASRGLGAAPPRSIPSTSPTSTGGPIRPSPRPSGAPPTRTASRARTAGLPASRARCPSSSRATRYRSSSPARPSSSGSSRPGEASASESSRRPTRSGARSAATR